MAASDNACQRPVRRIQILMALLAAGALAAAAPSLALTTVGAGAFSPTDTKLTFEVQTVDNAPISMYVGVTFHGPTSAQKYSSYSPELVTAASTAGLGQWGASWGCEGDCGTGFTLPALSPRVGLYFSSNVDIEVTIYAYRRGALLGSQTVSAAHDTIGFAGFADPTGIDQIVMGDNTSCTGCIQVMDNIMFVSAGSTAVPTMSEWGLAVTASLLAAGAALALRRRRLPAGRAG